MASTAAATTSTIAVINYAVGLLGIVTIISLLIVALMKEFGSGRSEDERSTSGSQFLLRTLDAPILATLAVFIVIVAVRVWEVLA